MLERITVEGFTSFRQASIDIAPGLNVLVGANGAGKSNLVGAFALLGNLVEQRLQLAVAQRGGATALLHKGSAPSEKMRLLVEFDQNTYEVTLASAAGDDLFFESEVVTYKGHTHERAWVGDLGQGHRETRLPHEAAEHDGGAASWALDAMGGWHVYHFHDTSRSAGVKQKGPVGDDRWLRHDASNLAAFLYRLERSDPQSYARILRTIQLVAPFLDSFDLRPDRVNDQVIQLEWRHRSTDAYFNAHALSDGTLRFICLATLLLQPDPPPLVLIDEPELGLHPFAIQELAEMLRHVRRQVVVSTQSVTLLDQLAIDDAIVVEQRDGASVMSRPRVEDLRAWLSEYSLGELWQKNLIGGRPRQIA